MLEFYAGSVVLSKLQKSDDRVTGYGFIQPDGNNENWIWFGAKTTNGTMLEKGRRVKFALASTPSKNGRLAASIVRPFDKEGIDNVA